MKKMESGWFSILKWDFPKNKKKVMDPTLVDCVNSLQPTQTQGGSPIDREWTEKVDDSAKTKLMGLAQQWIDTHVQCVQYPESWNEQEKPPLGKCVVDDFDEIFFNLFDDPCFQFVLSAHGPGYTRLGWPNGQHCDQKFILFSFKNGELSGSVICKNSGDGSDPYGNDSFTDYQKSVSLVDFPDGAKGLLLSTSDQCYGETGHLFKDVQGNIKDVLDFQKTVQSCEKIDGTPAFDSLLIPQGANGLKLVKRNWSAIVYENVEPEKGNDYHYSGVFYQFDSESGKYLQVGEEKDLPKGKTPTEWME